jgi:hypothetical protein
MVSGTIAIASKADIATSRRRSNVRSVCRGRIQANGSDSTIPWTENGSRKWTPAEAFLGLAAGGERAMGMRKEYNDYLVDAAPSLLQACKDALEAFESLAAGKRTPQTLAEYRRMFRNVIAEAEGPYGDCE